MYNGHSVSRHVGSRANRDVSPVLNLKLPFGIVISSAPEYPHLAVPRLPVQVSILAGFAYCSAQPNAPAVYADAYAAEGAGMPAMNCRVATLSAFYLMA